MRLMGPAELEVRLRSEMFPCTYDPRLGPDQERSGDPCGQVESGPSSGGPAQLAAARGLDGVLDLA